MQILAASLILASALVAAPAAADVVHRTSIVHQGSTMAVSYEPRFETSHKQTGIGPRASAGCLWTTRTAALRSVADASGRSVAALTRLVGEEKVSSGMQAGYCRDMAPERTAAFGGDAEKLRHHLSAAAEQDAHGLYRELASLEGLRAAVSR